MSWPISLDRLSSTRNTRVLYFGNDGRLQHEARAYGPGRLQEIADALSDIETRGRPALDRLLPIVYDELKAIAHRQRRRERSDLTLNTTDLVHEAYVRLIGLDRMNWQNKAHVLAVAAQAMRRVLVDCAEARRAQKRGGVVTGCRSTR